MRGWRHPVSRCDSLGSGAVFVLASVPTLDGILLSAGRRLLRGRPLRLSAGLFVFLLQFALVIAASAQTEKKPDPQAALRAQEPCKIMAVGFNGGLESPNNRKSGIVQLRDRLNTPEYPGVCFRNFLPYSWPRAYRWLLKSFPKHGGRFTREEVERGPRVILMGHSLGGMTTLILARLLGGRGIPVELTVQLASFGLADATVPSNVKNAANFYVHDAIGRLTKKHVKVKDPAATHFYGNILVTGFDHVSVTRAPQISDLVVSTVRSLLAANAPPAVSPANPDPR